MISLPLRNTQHPLPPRQPARSGSHRHGDTPAAPKRRVGAVDGPPQPIWPIVGPPKLAPEGGPGLGGQSKGTWTLVLARPHGVEPKCQKSAQIIVPGVGWLPAAVQRHRKKTTRADVDRWIAKWRIFFLFLCWPNFFSHPAAYNYNGHWSTDLRVDAFFLFE